VVIFPYLGAAPVLTGGCWATAELLTLCPTLCHESLFVSDGMSATV